MPGRTEVKVHGLIEASSVEDRSGGRNQGLEGDGVPRNRREADDSYRAQTRRVGAGHSGFFILSDIILAPESQLSMLDKHHMTLTQGSC